jgi:hypothetical protein
MAEPISEPVSDLAEPVSNRVQPMSNRARRLLGLVLFLFSLLATGAMVIFWPTETSDRPVRILCGAGAMPRESNLLLLAMIFGALGSLLHAAKSFASFAGNRSLVGSWAWWYAFQPFVGMTLAAVFYMAIRGGLFASGSSAAAVSPHGIAGVSGMVGMFAKQATDKLNELFCSLFQTAADSNRSDKLQP